MSEKTKDIIWGIFGVLLVGWIFASWIDAIIGSVTQSNAWWNMFVLITKMQ